MYRIFNQHIFLIPWIFYEYFMNFVKCINFFHISYILLKMTSNVITKLIIICDKLSLFDRIYTIQPRVVNLRNNRVNAHSTRVSWYTGKGVAWKMRWASQILIEPAVIRRTPSAEIQPFKRPSSRCSFFCFPVSIRFRVVSVGNREKDERRKHNLG